jgi:hypothetical protein
MLLETPESEVTRQLNAVKYVYLRDISDADVRVFNSLRIIVEEAVVNEAAGVRVTNAELADVLKGAHPIESVAGCRMFQLSWKHYLAYLVTEELVGSNAVDGYTDQKYTGRILREYTKSHFLDHVMRDTGGHIQDVRHYKLICLNHLVDVASYYAPEVELVSPREQAARSNRWR